MIKRPVTKKAAVEEEQDTQVAPKKLLKKAKVEPEPEEEEQDATPKKKKKVVEEEEETPRRKPKKKGGGSLADIFDSTKPGRSLFPVGEWRGIIESLELEGEIAEEGEDQEDLKVVITLKADDDQEDAADKTIRIYHRVWIDGEAASGIPYLKGDLDTLGYEDVILADLQEICEAVTAEEPQVVFKVVEKNGYTNAYLQGLADD